MALLAGLLSHIGHDGRCEPREYAGARGARFTIFPGSALARKPPAWVMVAELVETSRLWGRDAARIEPKWVEPLAEHLVTPHLLRAALGAQARRGRRHRAGDAVRAADRGRAHGRLRARSTRRCRASCSSAARWSRATGTRATTSSPTTRAASRRSRRWRTAPAGATSSSATRRCTTSSTRASPATSSPARTSTAGGATSAARDPELLDFTRELLIAPRAADARSTRGAPGGVAPGRAQCCR